MKCKRCKARTIDALHYCALCRQLLIPKLLLPDSMLRDIMPIGWMPPVRNGAGRTPSRLPKTIMVSRPVPAGPVPKCHRCMRMPRADNTMYCKGCLKEAREEPIPCRHCGNRATQTGLCSEHWATHGRRGPSGD